LRGQCGKVVAVQRRVCAADKNQIARHHTARDAPGCQNSRGKAMPGPKRVQRIKRGHGFGHAGRWCRLISIAVFQQPAATRIRDGKGHAPAQIGAGDERLGPSHRAFEEIRSAQNRAQRGFRRGGPSGRCGQRREPGQKSTPGRSV